MQASSPRNPPNFNYEPNDYFVLTIVVAIICGIFSIGSLFCTIPAVMLSVKVSWKGSVCHYLIRNLQSKRLTAEGKIKEGRTLGVRAVYLVVGAIVFALIAAIILTGVMIPALLRNTPCSKIIL